MLFFSSVFNIVEKYSLSFSFFLSLDNVVIYSEKDEFDKMKAPPQKTVKR